MSATSYPPTTINIQLTIGICAGLQASSLHPGKLWRELLNAFPKDFRVCHVIPFGIDGDVF